MAMAANAAKLETPLKADYASEADAVEGWASALIAYFKTMDRLPGTDAIIDGFKSSIKTAMAGMSNPGPPPPAPPAPQGPLKLQAGFVAAWLGIASQAAALYSGATTATPPPAVATIAAVILPGVFPLNQVPGVTKAQAATTTANALSPANATGGFWVLPGPVTVAIT